MAAKRSDAERLKHAAAQIRRQAAADEKALRRELLPTWRRIRADLDQRADELARKIAAAERQGLDISVSWLHRQERYRDLLEQVEARVGELSKAANQPITAYQATLLERAAENARALVEVALSPAGPKAVRTVMGDWNRLAVRETEAMIGIAGNGKPLGNLLGEIAPDARLQAREILTRGVALGKNPRVVARELRSVSDEAITRLTTIARTEGLRSQRIATRSSYRDNAGILQGWMWDAALDERTCEGCIAESGSVHSLDEEMETHICCRCSELPVTRSWDELGLGELGLGETSIADMIEPGPDWFERQSAEVQGKLLGPGKLEALRSGEIIWPDLVTRVEGKDGWPPMRRAATLHEARRHAAAR